MLFRFSVAVVFVSSLFAQNIPAPQALTVVAASASQVDLRWTGNSSATGYSIERKTLDGSYAAVLTASGTTVSDKTIDPYTTYVYRVRGTTQGRNRLHPFDRLGERQERDFCRQRLLCGCWQDQNGQQQ